jgi:hypothetical protein
VSLRSKHFARHYAEMVIAMYAGMALLLPFDVALAAFGVHTGDWANAAPAVSLAIMGASMTWPMVAWMRYRGHDWRPCWEMAGSMIVPTLAAIALLATGLVTSHGTLMTLEHVAMFPAMFIVMLARPNEYSGHAHGREVPATRVTA